MFLKNIYAPTKCYKIIIQGINKNYLMPKDSNNIPNS